MPSTHFLGKFSDLIAQDFNVAMESKIPVLRICLRFITSNLTERLKRLRKTKEFGGRTRNKYFLSYHSDFL